jgi:hypothetical protein
MLSVIVVIDIDEATDVSSWQGNLFINVVAEFVGISNFVLSFALFKLFSCVSLFIIILYFLYNFYEKKNKQNYSK